MYKLRALIEGGGIGILHYTSTLAGTVRGCSGFAIVLSNLIRYLRLNLVCWWKDGILAILIKIMFTYFVHSGLGVDRR